MLFSAGDCSGVFTPSSDPYATSVGGTTLGIGRDRPAAVRDRLVHRRLGRPATGTWIPQGEAFASGGGPSLLWAQPGLPARRRAELAGRGAGQPARSGPRAARHQRGRRPVNRDGRRAAELQPARATSTGSSRSPSAVPASPHRWWPAWWPTPSSTSGRSGSSTRRSTGWRARARCPRRAAARLASPPSRYRGVACDVA